MDADRPSATARSAALLRAAHQLFDRPPVLDDPVVLRLLGPDAEADVRANAAAFEEPARRRLRATIAARSRYAEDCLAAAVGRGVGQYVVLGAGLDSFAYRNPFAPSALRVFEVDHPATQAAKRRRLAAAGIVAPASVAFVAVDFQHDALMPALVAHGFSAHAAAFVSWLGVTVYLSREAVLETLAWAASLGAGSEIVFEVATSPDALGAAGRSRMTAMAARAAAAGEPWLSYFEPAELTRALHGLGFGTVASLGPDGVFARYFRDRSDGLRPGSASHLVRAVLP
jgi:methyltransferase (TIGR00027 family)